MNYIMFIFLLFFSTLSFSSENIKLVVSSGGGGVIHQYALKIAPILSRELDKKVIIEIKAGGEGYIAASYVKQFEKTNETVLLIGTPQKWKNIPNANLSHIHDFELLTFLGSTPTLLASSYDNRYSTIKQFLDASFNHKITYATSFTNPIRPLLKQLIEKYGNKDNFIEITYKSGSEAVAAAMGNHVDFAASVPETILEHEKAKKLKVAGYISLEKNKKLRSFKKLDEQDLIITDEFKYYPNIFLWSSLNSNKEEIEKIKTIIRQYLISEESIEMKDSMFISFSSNLDSSKYLSKILE